MATTTWIGGSGNWGDAGNWSNGVPASTDDAVFDDAASASYYTVSGGGVAASLSVDVSTIGRIPTFGGVYTVGTFVDNIVPAQLAAGATLDFQSGTISGGAKFGLLPDASLGSGPLTLDYGTLNGLVGTLTNTLVVVGHGGITSPGTSMATVAGAINGSGDLQLDGTIVLDSQSSGFAGGLEIGGSDPAQPSSPENRVTLPISGSVGSESILLGSGTLILDPGIVTGPITAAVGYFAEIDASDQAATVFAGQFHLTYENGSGHPLIIGATAPGIEYAGEGPELFGTMDIQGGNGSVTVFAGSSSGVFYGGHGGNNVIIAGPDLTGYTPSNAYFLTLPVSHILAYTPPPVTIFGGGDNDLLVASGTDNSFLSAPALNRINVVVAGPGRETLTGAGSSANNVFFGGTGSDVIAAGGGPSVIIAGSGAATISGGSGTAAMFAGTGQDILLGGTGADFVQVGSGNAVLFGGTGMDLIDVVSGQSGGGLLVSGFKAGTDQITSQGYASAPVVSSGGGNTIICFSDHTQITLLGVVTLPTSTIV